MKPIVKTCCEFSLVMAALVLFMIVAMSVESAKGSSICVTGSCRQVISYPVKRVQKAAVYVEPYYYAVADHLKQSASDTYGFRASDEYQEYLQLRAWREGYEEAKQQEQLGVEELPDPEEMTASRFPTMQAKCASCHSGDEAKGNLWLDGSVDLADPMHSGKRDAIMAKVYRGEMPPNKPLNADELGALIHELYHQAPEENE